MIEVQAPNIHAAQFPSIFLAGSIDNGAAENWQRKFCDAFRDKDVTIYNPRRDNWDENLSGDAFREQVEWELDHLEKVDLVVFYFAPGSISPITLLELGLTAESGMPIIVCCPKEFWRSGNVEIVCDRYDIPLVETLEDLISEIKNAF